MTGYVGIGGPHPSVSTRKLVMRPGTWAIFAIRTLDARVTSSELEETRFFFPFVASMFFRSSENDSSISFQHLELVI